MDLKTMTIETPAARPGLASHAPAPGLGESRTILVANRLPVSIHVERGAVRVRPSGGGLASALRGLPEEHCGVWFGWPGDDSRLSSQQRDDLGRELEALRAIAVPLSATQVARYYDGFSNGVLWPLFHYLLDKIPLDSSADYAAYREVNARFAEVVAAHHRPGDVIWVHDYQLALVPAMLRERLPDVRIGFFLHIPFPSSDVFQTLPWREEILRGMLGADVIGFHTATYAFHFAYAAAQLLGLTPGPDELVHEGRRVRIGAYPIGIDFEDFDALARSPEVELDAARIREGVGDRVLVLGVDRLDYTKGIPRRLLAIERLLERSPVARERLHFIQLAVPTREKVPAYEDYRRLVHEVVGRINGQFGSATRSPVHLMRRAVSPRELLALYRAAEIMLVTPLRDGMNLVAKEYVASSWDERGVLVLSEFAGAAADLQEALIVNPYDLDAVADALERAIEMPLGEQQRRMRGLRERVRTGHVGAWARKFLTDLRAPEVGRAKPAREPARALEDALDRVRGHRLLLLLDYDGTLVPLARHPDLAPPDPALLALLAALASQHEVHVVSGRDRGTMDAWLGALSIGLHAEHGFWSRIDGRWLPWAAIDLSWKPAVQALLERFVARTQGSHLEEKAAGLAWHYRAAEPLLAQSRLGELRALLEQLPDRARFEVVEGHKVLEVCACGVNKGLVASRLASGREPAHILAAGDDRTDEDTFGALAPGALSIRIGAGASRARFTLPDSGALRRVLAGLVVSA